MSDKWIIGYKDGDWKTVTIPSLISNKTIEMIIFDLNKNFDVIYMKVINGIPEKENHKTKKGDFIGL